jgi:CRISPR-associated protein Csm4
MIKTFDIVHLRFQTPLHISRGKTGSYESSQEMLHSDTLAAALYVTALQLYGQTVADEFKDKIRLSSAFPFDTDGYWLPKPLSFSIDIYGATHRKELKKIKYLRQPVFEKILKGQQPDITELLDANNKAQLPSVWQRNVTQRVGITYEDESTPFYLEKLYPKDGHKECGLYFLVYTEGAPFPYLQNLLHLLGDNGIGLQRTLGNGQFECDTINQHSLDLSDVKPSAWVALSLYRPTKEDISSDTLKIHFDKSRYELRKRGGWLSSPEEDNHLSLRKKAILMFAEGSVLAFGDANTEGVRGKCEDIKPNYDGFEHPVWRDGRAIFLPMI